MNEGAKLLPGIPSFDNPLQNFGQVNQQIKSDYISIADSLREKGYAVIDFPDEDFERRSDAIRSALDKEFDWKSWRNGGFERNESLRVQDAWKTNSDVQAIAGNTAIIEMLSNIYGRRARPFQSLNFPVGTQQSVHSDASHFASMPAGFMCGVWVALEDIEADAGPLFYYPGTQKLPVINNEHLSVSSLGGGSVRAYGEIWDAIIKYQNLKAERFLARKGQALIWSSNILHGGDRQTNINKTRWSQVTHYFFDGCAYYTPFFSDPFHGSIAFKDPIDISSGETLQNTVGGRPIDPGFIADANARARQVRNGQIAAYDARYAALEAELKQQFERNERLKASLSWRITAPLRRIGRSRSKVH